MLETYSPYNCREFYLYMERHHMLLRNDRYSYHDHSSTARVVFAFSTLLTSTGLSIIRFAPNILCFLLFRQISVFSHPLMNLALSLPKVSHWAIAQLKLSSRLLSFPNTEISPPTMSVCFAGLKTTSVDGLHRHRRFVAIIQTREQLVILKALDDFFILCLSFCN